ncbi:hypothetical protein [Algoriphagus aquimarinus]|uniref:Uncharacterized protein n=1 Tax=Algoriphagus aquimarinus TaxID=237018 RepID=A0A5C7AZ28_9BACT|nr:hypothetical protein [Algoriphagus aquimarinus]TXE14096.1 hypothetical protein ESV85_00615 [Algoriphagus aquimarinus]
MLKRNWTIVTMLLALAIMLGHNIFPHHHHEENKELAQHHHSDDHHHDTDHESPSESPDFEHLFSVLQHAGNGVTFLTGNDLSKLEEGKIISSIDGVTFTLFSPISSSIIGEKSPPFRPVFRNFKYFLPTGLRAPPARIV